jgi:hypothetical protein
MACPASTDNTGENDLTGIDAEDFGASGVISRTFSVGSKDNWDSAISAINSGGNNKNYVINLTNDVAIPGGSSYTFNSSITGITVSLRGQKTLSLASGAKGYLLATTDKQTLILRETTLAGLSDNTKSLVYVAGTFTMHSGKISGNTVAAENSRGGGVYVYEANATFTMSGGEILDNAALVAGGVYVDKGRFTMSGGKIYKNKATSSTTGYGGGVYVSTNGNFTLSGGEIYENTAVDSGGGVVISTAGFTMSGGEIRENTAGSGGGGVSIFSNDSESVFTLTGGKIHKNKVTATDDKGFGGGVDIYKGGTLNMSGGVISGNSAVYGGGVFVDQGGRLNKTGGVIYGADAVDDALRNKATGTFTSGNETFATGNALTRAVAAGDGESSATWYHSNNTVNGDIDTANPLAESVILRRNSVVPAWDAAIPQ